MRPFVLILVLLSTSAAVGPACAIEADDAMTVWRHASEKDRSALLDQILGKEAAASAGVARCMDETSKTPGHADLKTSEVAKVCASAGNAEQPV